MIQKATQLLAALGVTATGDPLLPFLLETRRWKVQDMVNRNDLPEELEEMAVRMAVGAYLQAKQAAGSLSVQNLDLSAAGVKTLSEGDTTVTFDRTPEQRLDALITALATPDMDRIHRYRRLVW